MQSLLLADDLHFGLERDAAFAQRGRLHLLDQRQHIAGGGARLSLTMKLPCISDTFAPPMRVPLRPSSSTSLPAGHRSGVFENAARRSIRAAGCCAVSASTRRAFARSPPACSGGRRTSPRPRSFSRSVAAVPVVHVHLRPASSCESRRARSTKRTLTTCRKVSPPIAPAFMRKAPPTFPGMPSSHSKPPICASRAA